MKYIVLDLHGIIYCHDPKFDLNESSRIFRNELEKYERLDPAKYKGAIEKEDNGDTGLAHLIEYDSISKGFSDGNYLKLYFLPEALEKAGNVFVPDNRIIIISSALKETIKFVLSEYMKKANITYEILDEDQYDSSEHGSKKDKNMWKKIFSKYPKIDAIVEDKEANLVAAGEAVAELGYNVVLFNSLKDY